MMGDKIRGIVPVLHTPFTANGNIDEDALINIVNFLCEKSISAIWVLGTGGEDMNITFSDRQKIVRIVHSANAGRKQLLVGCSFYALEESLNFVDYLNDYEISGVHYMPYQQLISLERIKFSYLKIAEKSVNPVWMYSSANWCQLISPSFVREMKDTPNIVGMKYSTSNAAHLTEVAQLADDNFNVISAVASTLFSSLSVGVDGSTSSLAGAFPEVLIDIYNKFISGRHKEALEAQRKLNSFVSTWPKALFKDNFLKGAEEKCILEFRQLSDRFMSSYYRDATDDEYEIIIKNFKLYYPDLT
jgi:4-hydroxy-tetrahydrodipicolinate synthase